MPILNHLHTLVRISPTRPNAGMYRCIDPYCTAILDKEEIIDKAARCTKCGTEIIIDRDNLINRAAPNCLSCRNSKEARELRERESTIMDALKKLEISVAKPQKEKNNA